MPPPSTSLSHLESSVSMTPILEDTLEPPTMAANGRTGLDTAPSYSSDGRVSKRTQALQNGKAHTR